MNETTPGLATYRKDILSKVFNYIQGAESFYIIGAASMGKTRLLDALMQKELQEAYLPHTGKPTWIVRVDLNRLTSQDNWAFSFFELMLSSLLLESGKHDPEMQKILMDLTSEVIEKRDPLRAFRFLEFAIVQLCQMREYKICFLFDEFDETYHKLPREIFAQLRAIRDAHKTRLCYALILRNLPERLRTTIDNESFYELLSRNKLGLGPYNYDDSLHMMQIVQTRRGTSIPVDVQKAIYEASGGHPGLIQALLSIMIDNPNQNANAKDIEWLQQERVSEECRKIWEGLLENEKAGLLAVVRSGRALYNQDIQILYDKGLLNPWNDACFSPIFARYIQDL